jgi:hypothetical protein
VGTHRAVYLLLALLFFNAAFFLFLLGEGCGERPQPTDLFPAGVRNQPQRRSDFPEVAASMVGLLGSPSGQGPFLVGAALEARRVIPP